MPHLKTIEIRILRRLRTTPLTRKDIEQSLNISRQKAAAVLWRMIKKGYIYKHNDFYIITDKGMVILIEK